MTTRQRLVLPDNSSVHGPLAPHAKVVNTSPGPVTLLDKVKQYYKGVIAVLTAVLAIANQLTPVFDFLPVQDKGYVTSAIVAVGAVLTALKANEHWVDDA